MSRLVLALLSSSFVAASINFDEDEPNWSIGADEEDDYEYTDDLESVASLLDAISLKSAERQNKNGGIRVRNMGRIMKMSMFLQGEPAKQFIRTFKRYGCHCWPKGRVILGGQGKPIDAVDK
jgi:hypothetical protein